MSKKRVVSIEDRIPKLKQMRKRKANRRLIFYLSIFFILISIIIYLQSPLSHIKTIAVKGNSFVTNQEVIDKSELQTDMNIWTIDENKVERSIRELAVVDSVKVTRKIPWTIEIEVSEYERVGYIKNGDEFFPILGNGNTLQAVEKPNGDAPLILDFTDDAYLNRMTKELTNLPKNILNLISEIHWNPEEENPNKITLYMNDGFIVSGTIRDFAEKMQVYPSITAQLDPNEKGIIHIGVGAYFEKLEDTTDEEVEEVSQDQNDE